jgi:hypothetical protein
MADYQLHDLGVLRVADGASIPNDPSNLDWQGYQDWLAADPANVPDPMPDPVVSKPQQITSSQFINRIPPAVLPVLWGNPQTGIMLIKLAAAGVIDLTDPEVQGGINALVPGTLTADQAAAILDH